MALNANAILTVQQFLDFTGQTRVLSDAFTIYNNSASNTTATVAVTDTTLVTVGSGTGTDTFTFANAAHDTMSELTAAITALAEGWQVELLSGGSVATGNLVPFAATDAYGQDDTLTLQYSNQSIIEDWINAASQAIEDWRGSIVVAQTDIRERVDGRGDTDLLLKNAPVTAVRRVAYGEANAFYVQDTSTSDLWATVEVQDSLLRLSRMPSNGTIATSELAFSTYPTVTDLVTAINAIGSDWLASTVKNWTTLDLSRLGGADALRSNVTLTYPENSASSRIVDENAALVKIHNGWDGFDDYSGRNQSGRYNYLVQYDAGWALASVPAPIVQACWMIVQKLQQAQGTDSAMQSESLGQYSYSRTQVAQQAAGFITGDIEGLLGPYKRWRF